MQGQRDEVSFSVRLLAVVEDQAVGVVGHENHGHAELLTVNAAQSKADDNIQEPRFTAAHTQNKACLVA